MEIILLAFIPILLLLLGAGMIIISQVSGFFSFRRYSMKQQQSNRIISDYLAKMTVAQSQVSARSRELAKISKSLSFTNQELERLNGMKSKFLSMAVHDVRTPLATIKGYAELLASRDLGVKENRYLEGIIVSSDRIGRLMSDLTDLAVIEAGKFKMDKAQFDVGGLIHEIVAIFAPLAAQRQVNFGAGQMQPGLMLIGDRFRLGQVLSNFIGNAIKFTPVGGRVEVRAQAGGEGVFFSVSDNGPGIHPSERKKIFEKFYQSAFSSREMSKKGWGLGLSIAQEAVRGHQGEIGVESAGLGKGAKFWFFIPAVPPRQASRTIRTPHHFLTVSCLLFALVASLLGARPAHAQAPGIPLDDKAHYDKFLEEKAEAVLMKILGPNRSKVIVDATLDFTRTERLDVSGGAAKEIGDKTASLFAWQNLVSAPSGPQELLPGIPMEDRPNGNATGQPVSYERKYIYPASFVKKLAVTILIDNSVTVEQSDSIQRIISDLLEIDPNRGDALTIVRTTFVPAWKTIWYSQDSFSMVFRYTVLSLMTMMILLVVAGCFMKLAGSMDAMAKVQSQQYAMDIGMKGEGGVGIGATSGNEGPGGEGGGEGGAKPGEPGEEGQMVRIKVLGEQVPILIEMLKSEDPDNVALVAAFLDPEILKEFLKGLPRPLEAGVLMRMAKVRFVEEDLIDKIKTEIERRLASAVGGMDQVYEILETKPPNLQLELLQELETKDPEMYKQLRPRVLLFEDVVKLSERDFSLLMAKTRVEDWATGLHDSPEALRETVRARIMPKTWVILEQIMQNLSDSPERRAEAESAIVEATRGLIADGKIQNPIQAAAEEPAGVAGGPGAKEAGA